MSRLEVTLLVTALVLLVVIIEVVRRRRLAEGFALLWMGVAVGVIVLGLARPLLDHVSSALGIEYGANLFFAGAVLFFVLVCLSLSIHISRLEARVESLAEEVAFLRGPRRASDGPPPPAADPESTM